MADLPARWVPFSQRQVREPEPRSSWISRAWSTVTTWVRSVGTPTPASRVSPPKPGITAGRVASSPLAEQDLAAMGSSPTVYAAVTRRAYSFGCYPKRVTLGLPRPGAPAKELGTETPWVAALYRLLETPDPADTEALAPVPGEYLQAQVFADLMLIGVAWIIPTVTEAGDIIGLTRFHPRMVTIIRRDGEDYVECRTSSGQVLLYRYRDVFHLRLLSWQASGQGLMGTGAAECLRPVVAAERSALLQTADVVGQGGADILVTAKTAASGAFLQNPDNRETLLGNLVKAIKGDRGRRIFIVPSDIELKDAGLKPADIRAPELMPAARDMQLLALGCTPTAVGVAGANYATAVQQARTQTQMDEELQDVFAAGFLRPLARRFARQAGGRAALKAHEVYCCIDLSTSPGYTYVRTEAVNRAAKFVDMGWSAEQAVAMEGIEAPKPLGTPKAGKLGTDVPGPDLGDVKDTPRQPVGDGGEGDPSADPNGRAAARSVDDLWEN